MGHGPDVSNFQTFLADGRCQDDAFVFSNHGEVSLLPGDRSER